MTTTTAPDTRRLEGQTTSRLRRWAWPASFVVVGLVLVVLYQRQAWTSGVNSDGGGNALQAWDLLHGNLLLSGWTVTDISFYTLQLPQLAVAERFWGLTPSVLHLTSALNYTLVVLGVALLAKGRERGKEGVVRALVAGGILLAPPLGATTTALLHDPDHLGTQIPLIGIWLILDRAQPRRWVPVAIAVLLTLTQIDDPMGLYQGVLPLLIVCGIRLYQRRDLLAARRLRGCAYELSLVIAGAVSVVAAQAALRLIRQAGGFVVLQPSAVFAPVRDLYSNVWITVEDLLTMFGADFSGAKLGAAAAIPLVHLAGVALAGWAITRALKHYATSELALQVLAVMAIVLLVAYTIRSGANSGPHELVGVLLAGAVLAGRLLAGTLISGRHLAACALVLVAYAGILVHDAVQPATASDPNRQLAGWLSSHNLRSGIGPYWNSDSVTFAAQNRVVVAPVYFDPSGHLVGENRASRPTWYNPAVTDATFLVVPQQILGCPSQTSQQWLVSARKQFGRPAATYRVDTFTVVVWNQNILRNLRLSAPSAPSC